MSLHSLALLRTPPDPIINDMARSAAELFRASTALVTLLDSERQWFKAHYGLDNVQETSRAVAFCSHTLAGEEVLLVEDATTDSRFKRNPLVTGELGLKFFVGVPLITQDGERLGALGVLDRRPRTVKSCQMSALMRFAYVISARLAKEHVNHVNSQRTDETESGITTSRERVLEQATKQLLQQGPDSFSFEKVALRAQITISELQHCFPDRAALLRSIAKWTAEEFEKLWADHIEPISTPVDRLIAFACACFEERYYQRLLHLQRILEMLVQSDELLLSKITKLRDRQRWLIADLVTATNRSLNTDQSFASACSIIALINDQMSFVDDKIRRNYKQYVLQYIVKVACRIDMIQTESRT